MTEDSATPSLLSQLPGDVKTVLYKKGQILLHPHEATDYLYIIFDGMIKAYTINRRGDEAIAMVYGSGDIFPMTQIIAQHSQNAFFEAMNDCKVALIPHAPFMRQLKDNAELMYSFMAKILEEVALYSSRVSNLEFRFGRERLAYRLLVLGGRFGETDNGWTVLPSISQIDLAASVNMSRESVNREMARFERLGIVESHSSKIVIKDIKLLQKELGEDGAAYFQNLG